MWECRWLLLAPRKNKKLSSHIKKKIAFSWNWFACPDSARPLTIPPFPVSPSGQIKSPTINTIRIIGDMETHVKQIFPIFYHSFPHFYSHFFPTCWGPLYGCETGETPRPKGSVRPSIRKRTPKKPRIPVFWEKQKRAPNPPFRSPLLFFLCV